MNDIFAMQALLETAPDHKKEVRQDAKRLSAV